MSLLRLLFLVLHACWLVSAAQGTPPQRGCGKRWQQCGGFIRSQSRTYDRPWRCCIAQHACVRVNRWWWHCEPANPKPTRATTATKRPTGRQPAPPASKPNPTKPRHASGRPANRRTAGSSGYTNPLVANGNNPQQPFWTHPTCYEAQAGGSWCSRPPVTGFPPWRPGLKIGRQTFYDGPIGHTGQCGEPLAGSAELVGVALSSKYMGEYMTAPCGQCICAQIIGYDETSNPTPPTFWSGHQGAIFKGKVVDKCPECEDEHIDVLMAAPFTTCSPASSPACAANEAANAGVPRVMPAQHAYGVGIYKAQWAFAPCSADCTAYFGGSSRR